MHGQGFGNCVESDRLPDIQSTSAPLASQFKGRPRNSSRLAPAMPEINPLARGEQNAREGCGPALVPRRMLARDRFPATSIAGYQGLRRAIALATELCCSARN